MASNELWVSQQKKQEQKTQRYNANKVTITDPVQMRELLMHRKNSPAICETLFLPLVHDLFRLPRLREVYRCTISRLENDGDGETIVFRGECFARSREVRYERYQVSVTTYLAGSESEPDWTLVVQNFELASFFRAILKGDLPAFSERVFGYCYFTLSFYAPCSADPGKFCGTHIIQGHMWRQRYSDLSINWFQCFANQRELLFAGIIWARRFQSKILDDVIAVVGLRKMIQEYLE